MFFNWTIMIFGYFDAKTYREFFTIHVQIIEHRYIRAKKLVMVVNNYIFDKHSSETGYSH